MTNNYKTMEKEYLIYDYTTRRFSIEMHKPPPRSKYIYCNITDMNHFTFGDKRVCHPDNRIQYLSLPIFMFNVDYDKFYRGGDSTKQSSTTFEILSKNQIDVFTVVKTVTCELDWNYVGISPYYEWCEFDRQSDKLPVLK